MEEKKSLRKAFEQFSDRLKKFNEADHKQIVKSETSSQKLELTLREREELLRKTVLKKYSAYVHPVSKDIEIDEKNLLDAYTLFKAVMEKTSGDSTAQIKKLQIYSPLVNKENYTKGREFIYLSYWLRKEKNAVDFVPVFERLEDKSYCLNFIKAEDYEYSSEEKAVVSILQSI